MPQASQDCVTALGVDTGEFVWAGFWVGEEVAMDVGVGVAEVSGLCVGSDVVCGVVDGLVGSVGSGIEVTRGDAEGVSLGSGERVGDGYGDGEAVGVGAGLEPTPKVFTA
jgi:hypothetical protein